eukprot:g15002.t1
MLGSFLEGAKATVRRVGEVDPSTDSVGGHENSLQSSQGSSAAEDVPHQEPSSSTEGSAGRGADNSSAAQSVSRSFSLLRASGARAILPVKKALGGDPEVIEARERLTKYKAKLSAAVTEAAAAAVTRREERELLTRALAGQENDLRCWGYLSVLPFFRDHRRKETNRAQLLVSMAERREEVMSAKLQEVAGLLRSLPIIGPWANKQRPGGTVDTAVAGNGGGSWGQNCAFRNGRFNEEEFAVAPADLLAFDEELALARRRLLSYDRECAAAADAFAMKVVAAGGLEPRSSEDRTQTLLSLLSRYHVLGDDAVTGGHASSRGEEGQAPVAVAVKDCGTGKAAPQPEKDEEGGVTANLDKGVPAAVVDDVSGKGEAEASAADARESQTDRERGLGVADRSGEETTFAGPGENRDGELRKEKEGAGGRQKAERKSEGASQQSEDAAQESDEVAPGEAGNAGQIEPNREAARTGLDPEAADDDTTGQTASAVAPTESDRKEEEAKAAAVDGDDGGGSEDARRRAATRAGFSTRTREECEQAFVELMLDERNREGRLLRRFLTMAQARNSPAAPTSPSSSPSSSSYSSSSAAAATARRPPAANHARPDSRGTPPAGAGASVGYKIADAAAGAFSSLRVRAWGTSSPSASGGGGHAPGDPNPARAGVAARVAGVGEGAGTGAARVTQRRSGAPGTAAGEKGRGKGHGQKKGQAEGEDWDGSVGPQVVKAFINYFSKEYLVNKFHVPDVLVPSLTELVALLVFRQARRLVFGYDRRRVKESDLAWREKSRTVRSASLCELGAPWEYIPASTTPNTVGATGTEAKAVSAPAATAEAYAREEEGFGGTSGGVANSTEPTDLTPPDSGGQGAVSSALEGAAPQGSTTSAAASAGPDVKPAGVAAGASAPSEGMTVASAAHGEEEHVRMGGAKEETASAASVGAAISSTVTKEQDQERAQERHREEEETREGSAYARASREFERLGACTTPAEMLGVVKAGMTSLCDAAARISGSDKPLDADTLLPLLVHALAHANLPRVHEALNFLRNFRGPSWGGEDAYYVTCIEAAVSFVLDWSPGANDPGLSAGAGADDGAVAAPGPEDKIDGDSCESQAATTKVAPAARQDGSGGGGGGGNDDGDAAVAARRAEQARIEEREQQEKGREALLRLGIFLEKHEVQEDTVDVLSSAGWLYALGPAVPSLSRDLGVAETSFGTGFSLRGLGYLLGSWCCSLRVPVGRIGHSHWLNDRMHRLGGATAGLGLFALALDTARAFWLVCLFCFCQGFCGGAVDAIANAAISVVHGADVAPWMQGLHFCFSAGALFAPAAVGRLGYRNVFLAFGLLSLPVGVACWLAAAPTASAAAAARSTETGGKHSLLVEDPNDPPLPGEEGGGGRAGGGSVASEARGVEMVEVNSTESARTSAAATESRGSLLDRTSNADEGAAAGALRPTGEQDKLFEVEAQTFQPPSSAAVGGSGGDALEAQEWSPQAHDEASEARIGGPGEGPEKRDLSHSVPSPSDKYAGREKAQHGRNGRRQPDGAAGLPLHSREDEDEGEGEGGGDGGGKLPSVALVGLLALFFFLYVGVEVGFGAWVAVVVLRDSLAGEAGAALMASIFWGGITAGRLLAVPLAVRFPADLLVRVNLVGGLLSSVLLWLLGREGILWAGVGAALFGLFMASTYPLAMSLLPSAGYVLSDKNSSRFVTGGALGEMLIPAFIAWFLGPNSVDVDGDVGGSVSGDGVASGHPAALYRVCVAVSALLVAVYGAWFRLVEAAATVSSP